MVLRLRQHNIGYTGRSLSHSAVLDMHQCT